MPPTFSLQANLDMLMGKRLTSNIITTFLSWYYITIQKIIRNGQAVLEILIFEKSSDLIGREFGQTGFFQKNRFSENDRRPFHFRQKKVHINGLDFCQNSKNLIFRAFWVLFAQIWANRIFPEKSGSVTFDPL